MSLCSMPRPGVPSKPASTSATEPGTELSPASLSSLVTGHVLPQHTLPHTHGTDASSAGLPLRSFPQTHCSLNSLASTRSRPIRAPFAPSPGPAGPAFKLPCSPYLCRACSGLSGRRTGVNRGAWPYSLVSRHEMDPRHWSGPRRTRSDTSTSHGTARYSGAVGITTRFRIESREASRFNCAASVAEICALELAWSVEFAPEPEAGPYCRPGRSNVPRVAYCVKHALQNTLPTNFAQLRCPARKNAQKCQMPHIWTGFSCWYAVKPPLLNPVNHRNKKNLSSAINVLHPTFSTHYRKLGTKNAACRARRQLQLTPGGVGWG
eukprot:3536658-Rhodomonas_salina.1